MSVGAPRIPPGSRREIGAVYEVPRLVGELVEISRPRGHRRSPRVGGGGSWAESGRQIGLSQSVCQARGFLINPAVAGVDRLIRVGYGLLHLVTFFTVGPKETRAWTVTKGSRAPQAAGVIHTDFERGFIRAEVAAYDDFVAHGGEQGAKEAGKLRLEGKDYVVRDGDVIHFRFNV